MFVQYGSIGQTNDSRLDKDKNNASASSPRRRRRPESTARGLTRRGPMTQSRSFFLVAEVPVPGGDERDAVFVAHVHGFLVAHGPAGQD